MTLADQAAMTGQDGRVTDEQPGRPKRRRFTKAYKARILAAYDALAEGSPERGALLRSERLYHSHFNASCARSATIGVMIIFGPLNYVGLNPSASCRIPEPSK